MRSATRAGVFAVVVLLLPYPLPSSKVPVVPVVPASVLPSAPQAMDAPADSPEATAEPGVPVEAPAESPEEEEPPSVSAWEVCVVDGSGLPLEGVEVRHAWCSEGEPGCSAVTDPDGRAVLSGYADRGGPDEGRFPVVTGGVVPEERWLLDSPFTLLRVRHGLPLEVRVVHARTGHPLGGGVATRLEGEGRGAGPLAEMDGVFTLPDSFLLGGKWGALRIGVDLPPGMARLGHGGHPAAGEISRFAESLRVTVPAWNEASILLRVADHDGRPVQGAHIVGVTFGLDEQEFRGETSDQVGRLEVRGIPDLPGEAFRVILAKEKTVGLAGPIRTDGSGAPRVIEALMGWRMPAGEVLG